MTAGPILEAAGVSKRFASPSGAARTLARLLGASAPPREIRALSGIDLRLFEGEVVGLVGESGCGKSTLGRIMAGILAPTEGVVRYKGDDVSALSRPARRSYELSVQMVFQDHLASLNPRRRVVDLIGEAPVHHGLVRQADADAYVSALLGQVGFDPAIRFRYPHQLSGGQRARVSIARALAVKPKVLICDESTAALDVSIQAQILNLFVELKAQLGLTYLFITHDLSVVRYLADQVVVMYLGEIVERAPAEALFAAPNHPYSRALIAEMPRLGGGKRAFAALKGELPSPLNPPSGCHFHPRCPHAMARCRQERPVLREVAPGRHAACHLNDGAAPAGAEHMDSGGHPV